SLGGLLGDLGTVLVVLEATLALEVVVHLGLDDLLGKLEVGGVGEQLEELLTGLHGLVVDLDAAGLLAQVLAQLLEGVELGGELSEVVISLGQLAGLHCGHLDGDLRVLTGVLASGERTLVRGLLASAEANENVVETLEHVAGAHLVGGALHGVDVVAVNGSGKVKRHEVALSGGAVNANERAEALTQSGQASLDVLIGDLGRGDLDLQRVSGGK